MCCTRLAGNAGPPKSPKIRHLGIIAQLCRAICSQLRHVSTIGKKLLNSNICHTCPHNMVNFGPLTAEIRSGVFREILFLALSVTFFVCVWNISGTTERICTKFIRKTCLVPHSDEFEGLGQRSRSPGTKTAFSALSVACMRFMLGKTSLDSSWKPLFTIHWW